MEEKQGYVLVFSGGGGKGAYEIGVWKAMRECGLERAKAVSGTSIGAFNACLYAIGDYEMAEHIWSNINEFQVLTADVKKALQELRNLGALSLTPVRLKLLLKAIDLNVTTPFQEENWDVREGVFTREGFVNILTEHGICNRLKKEDIPCYAASYRFTGEPGIVYSKLNDMSEEMRTKNLLASTAIPGVFDPEEIEGELYCDGGIRMGDNIPVKPLYELGYRRFVVVHLAKYTFDDIDINKKYEDADFLHIIPSEGMLDKVGTMTFTAKMANRLIELGYEDGMRAINMHKSK